MINFDGDFDEHGHIDGTCKRALNVTIFVSGTFDIFDVTCKRAHRTALNPFLNGTKNGDVDGTCKRSVLNFLRAAGDT